ncbi:hypothetical protein [Flavobacterium sp. HJJ]|uniref:hypothetical protein n=1 Tax=Flavobacterium sp. HJJ TaxID=2783792 RepID=UPI00188A08CE|nr:hypothetical protein [Flavobacterium sp. HJJ]MBF4471528.1 hypothetical protein [Flavobacterium sp. HJJ]
MPKDFSVKKIDVQGEAPSWIDGNSFWCFDGMCPEVNLFVYFQIKHVFLLNMMTVTNHQKTEF